MLTHFRTQFPVGQGFFHVGHLLSDDGTRFSYVVDCGAMRKYSSARDREIARLTRGWDGSRMVDILFISHAHDDHINGLPLLFAKRRGLRVDTVMMPLMSMEERLIAFARTSVEEPAAAASEFYREFILDPVSAISQFEPNQIVLVEGDSPGGGGAPFSRPQDNNDGGPDGADLLTSEARGWKPVGKGVIYRNGQDPNGHSRIGAMPSRRSPSTVVMPDSSGVLVRPASGIEWLLAPYIDPMVGAKKATFTRALAGSLKTTAVTLRARLADPDYVLNLLAKHESELRDAYSRVVGDLNITSMCIYSGLPRNHRPATPASFRASLGRWRIQQHQVDKIAWLGTGDADLKHHLRRQAFLRHYGKLLEEVITLTLPHHGSEGNFHPELVARTQPRICVAAADSFGKWRHPGSGVVQSLASFGNTVHTVTSAEMSLVHESFDLP